MKDNRSFYKKYKADAGTTVGSTRRHTFFHNQNQSRIDLVDPLGSNFAYLWVEWPATMSWVSEVPTHTDISTSGWARANDTAASRSPLSWRFDRSQPVLCRTAYLHHGTIVRCETFRSESVRQCIYPDWSRAVDTNGTARNINEWTSADHSPPGPRFTNHTYSFVGASLVRNLPHVDLRTTVGRSRGNPLDPLGFSIWKRALETFENPEILRKSEDFLEVNAGE